jgi:hypothetical protein
MKLPDRFSGRDWLTHLLGAIERTRGTRVEWPEYRAKQAERILTQLKQQGVEPFQLAVAIEQIAREWREPNDLYVVLSPGYVLYPTRQLCYSDDLWRAVYMSRYASTQDEVDYYAHWLSDMEAAEGEMEMPQARRSRQRALEKLTAAEHKIVAEDRQPAWLCDFSVKMCLPI